MLKYTLQRALYMLPILFGITIVTFLLFNVVGGDPAAQLAGRHASPEQVRVIRQELGLDKPLIVQYVNFVRQIATFDYGRSWSTKQEVSSMIWNGLDASLSLTVPSFAIGLVLAIVISLMLAYYRGGRLDRTVMIACLALTSLSSLVYILYAQYFLSYKMNLFPVSGWDPDWIGRWAFLILPILIFVILSLGGDVLFYRAVFMDETTQDYVRTARAKGLNNSSILFKHILRNAMIPIITQIAISMPFLILGSLLLENFFSIPGLGGIVVKAIQESDFPVVKAMTVIGALLYMFFQLVSDIFYALADPKVQLR